MFIKEYILNNGEMRYEIQKRIIKRGFKTRKQA